MSNINTLLLRVKYALESLENEEEQKEVVEKIEAYAAQASEVDNFNAEKEERNAS